MAELDGKGRHMEGPRLLLKATAWGKRSVLDKQLGAFDGVTWMPKGLGCDGYGCHRWDVRVHLV